MTAPTPITRLTGTAKLPSGRTIQMRELTGADELHAGSEVSDYRDPTARVRLNWALVARSVTHIDEKPAPELPPEAFRDLFTSKDWIVVQSLYDQLHGLTEDELGSFRAGFRISA